MLKLVLHARCRRRSSRRIVNKYRGGRCMSKNKYVWTLRERCNRGRRPITSSSVDLARCDLITPSITHGNSFTSRRVHVRCIASIHALVHWFNYITLFLPIIIAVRINKLFTADQKNLLPILYLPPTSVEKMDILVYTFVGCSFDFGTTVDVRLWLPSLRESSMIVGLFVLTFSGVEVFDEYCLFANN